MPFRCVSPRWARPSQFKHLAHSVISRRAAAPRSTLVVQYACARTQLWYSSSERPVQPKSRKGPERSTPTPNAPIAQIIQSSVKAFKTRENIYTLPNILTGTRLLAAPAVGYLILNGHLKYALGLFAYAGVTDLVDGWIARRYKLQTVVGSVIDPMADKLLMTIVTVALAVKGLLPAYLATLILGRDVSLAIAAIYYRYASLPAPKTLARYWDFSLPSAEVHPTSVSKANTFLQLVLVGSTLALPVLATGVSADPIPAESLERALGYFQYVVAGTTIWSGASYAVLKNVVDILGPDEVVKARQGSIGRMIVGITFGAVLVTAAWLALPDNKKQEVVTVE